VPVSVEAVSPERTFVIISHVVPFAINAFEGVRARQALSSFETRGIKFGVSFAAPC